MTETRKKENLIEYLISLAKLPFEFSKKESEIVISKFFIVSFIPGGAICWMYFFSIKYMPELDIQSIILLLSGASILGWFILVSIPYFIVFPGVAWKYIADKDKSLEVFTSKKELKLNLRTRKFSLNSKLNNKKRIFCFVYTLVGNTFLFVFAANPQAFFGTLCFSLYILMFLSTIYYAQKNRFLSWNNFLKSLWISAKIWFYSLYSFFAYVICGILVIMFFLSPIKNMQCYKINEILESLITVFVLFALTSIFVIIDNSNYFGNSITIGLILLLFSMMLLNNLDSIPGLVIKIYGWGNIENATIIVDRRGCQAIENMGIKVDKQCSKADMHKFNGVYILSSIGKSYYLKFPEYYPQGESDSIKFFLPSSSVVSWSRQNIEVQLPSPKKKGICNNLVLKRYTFV
jgi:hypothetical protein